MNEAKLVTVVIPSFNRWFSLQSTIRSVVTQSHRPLELIVVDDGSTDETPNKCQDFLSKLQEDGLSCRYIKQDNQGAPAARNLGIRLGSGDYFQFLDSDDLLLPHKIADQLSLLAVTQDPKAAACCPWINRFVTKQGYSSDQLMKDGLPEVEEPMGMLTYLLQGWFFPPHGYLWPRQLVEEMGGWDESLTADQDGDFAMRAILMGAVLTETEAPGVIYLQHEGDRISARSSTDRLVSRYRVVKKVHDKLLERGVVEKFQSALASRYFLVARLSIRSFPSLAKTCLAKCYELDHEFKPSGDSWSYQFVYNIFGLWIAETLNALKQRLRVQG